MATEVQRLSGTEHLYTLQPGEVACFYSGAIIVVHPERPPKAVHSDGKVEELQFIEVPDGERG